MKKSFVSMILGLFVSNSAFAMGGSTSIATAVATATATVTVAVIATAIPTQSHAGTLNPPELIYEDEKVKVEKVWEKEFPKKSVVEWANTRVSRADRVRIGEYSVAMAESETDEFVEVFYPKRIQIGNYGDGNLDMKIMDVFGEVKKDIKDKFFVRWFNATNRLVLASYKEKHDPISLYICDENANELWSLKPGDYAPTYVGEDFIINVNYSNETEKISKNGNIVKFIKNTPPDIESITGAVTSDGKYEFDLAGEVHPTITKFNIVAGKVEWRKTMHANQRATFFKVSNTGDRLIVNYTDYNSDADNCVFLGKNGDILNSYKFSSIGNSLMFINHENEGMGMIHFSKPQWEIICLENSDLRIMKTSQYKPGKFKTQMSELSFFIKKNKHNVFMISRSQEDDYKYQVIKFSW